MKKFLSFLLFGVAALCRGQAIDYAYHLTSAANHLDGLPVGTSGVSSIDCTSNLASVATCLGGPVTTTGTFTITFQNQNANTVFMGPNTGSAALPSFRAPNNTDLNKWGAAHALCNAYPNATWTNTTETDVITCSIPGGVLLSTSHIHFVAYGTMLVNDAASTIQVRVYYGATTMFNDTKGNPGANAVAGGWMIEGDMANTGTTNSQFMGGFMDWGNRVAAGGGGNSLGAIAGSGSTNNIVGAFGGTAAEDSTVTKTFHVTITFATATTVSATVRYYAVDIIP